MSTDYKGLCRELIHAVDTGNIKSENTVLCGIRAAISERTTPTDGVLLELLKNHPLRTDILLAAKEMAEFHEDAGEGPRTVRMLSNVISYARLVLKVYGP